MNKGSKNDHNWPFIKRLLEEKIARLKGELAESKMELEKMESKMGTGEPAKKRARNSKTKRVEELILTVLSDKADKSMGVGEIIVALKKIEPELDPYLIRRTLSRMGQSGLLVNPERGIWKRKVEWSGIPESL